MRRVKAETAKNGGTAIHCGEQFDLALCTLGQTAAHQSSRKFARQTVMNSLEPADWHQLHGGNAEWAVRHQPLKFVYRHLVQAASHLLETSRAIGLELGTPAHERGFAKD
jgi:hypothetical protein